ncbi:hypothetical protein COEREDRAFT_6370 [Coemansia reversa NRRL 1564]|uniref:Uncharacterized protein n=1 Tax=Coemansia reversa (strain ATCC 12441 / NRRL 1564) TaxID=763665 RepID=A0A2G5BI39_COERN|nr:hypothetical protein COEREDRAFT_6370 [Coemansia reversa NRRL 1564]|eukprot:PIA18663.1 hypothetical protein COEREDRAFT_6370 [Coemansia reversa NRRL 1564]
MSEAKIQHNPRKYAYQYVLAFVAIVIIVSAFVSWSKTTRGPMSVAKHVSYSDALNTTLGFQHVYVVMTNKTDKRSNFEAIASLLDIDVQYIQSTDLEKAVAMREQNKYLADVESISELDTHARIYADIVDRNIQSALILRSDIDLELDIKMRLVSALDNFPARIYDSLIVGRTHSEPTELEANKTEELLRLTNGTNESSMQMQRYWTKKQFVRRSSTAHRTSFPRGISAYAVSRRMVLRLHRRLRQRMAEDAHGLEYILADVAMVGLSIVYSVSPPPVTVYTPEKTGNGQFLARSALYAMGLRSDDPSSYPPYKDWEAIWAS